MALPVEWTSRPPIRWKPLSLENAALALMNHLVGLGLPNGSRALLFQILEGSHRLGDEPLLRVAHLAVAECHGARAVICVPRDDEPRSGIGRLQEAGRHLQRDTTARRGVQRSPGDR